MTTTNKDTLDNDHPVMALMDFNGNSSHKPMDVIPFTVDDNKHRNSAYTDWYKKSIVSTDESNTRAKTDVRVLNPEHQHKSHKPHKVQQQDYIRARHQYENGFKQLVYACDSNMEIANIAKDTELGLRKTFQLLLQCQNVFKRFKHPKAAILNDIDFGIFNRRKSFVFMVFQSMRTEFENTRTDLANTTPSTNLANNPINQEDVSFLQTQKEKDAQDHHIQRFIFDKPVESLRAVVEIEKVEHRRCVAAHIISSTNPKLNNIMSTSYLFNIHVHKGNPEGYAVLSLLKGLGFRVPPFDNIESAKSDYLNSLIWFGEHKIDIKRYSTDYLNMSQSQPNADTESEAKHPYTPMFSSRKNHYTRRLRKSVIR